MVVLTVIGTLLIVLMVAAYFTDSLFVYLPVLIANSVVLGFACYRLGFESLTMVIVLVYLSAVIVLFLFFIIHMKGELPPTASRNYLDGAPFVDLLLYLFASFLAFLVVFSSLTILPPLLHRRILLDASGTMAYSALGLYLPGVFDIPSQGASGFPPAVLVGLVLLAVLLVCLRLTSGRGC